MMIKIVSLLVLLSLANFVVAEPLLLGLPRLKIPEDNPQTAAKIALGKKLFNEQRFSANGRISCASCHISSLAFTDGQAQAIGINGLVGKRNSPTIINSAYLNTLFHDGRRTSLEQQALDPLTNPIEHGLSNHSLVIDVIQRDLSYLRAFLNSFGISAEKISIDHVAKAIASYERTLISGNTRFDQYFFNAQKSQLTVAEARGLRTFRRKGNCANCHEISWNNALFTDNRFYNIGIGFNALRPVLPEFLKQLKNTPSHAIMQLTPVQKLELGRFIISRQLSDIGAYKTPTLRNIELTAPYMHDGSISTLSEVVEYYDKGGENNDFLNPAIFPLALSEQEKSDLVAFLKTLTDHQYTQQKH